MRRCATCGGDAGEHFRCRVCRLKDALNHARMRARRRAEPRPYSMRREAVYKRLKARGVADAWRIAGEVARG